MSLSHSPLLSAHIPSVCTIQWSGIVMKNICRVENNWWSRWKWVRDGGPHRNLWRLILGFIGGDLPANRWPGKPATSAIEYDSYSHSFHPRPHPISATQCGTTTRRVFYFARAIFKVWLWKLFTERNFIINILRCGWNEWVFSFCAIIIANGGIL